MERRIFVGLRGIQYTLIGVLGLLFITASAQKNKPSPQLLNQEYYEVVPFELVKGKIVIPVEIGGETYRFIFDTGGTLHISQRIKDTHKIEVLGQGTVRGINRLKTKLSYVRVPEVKIGNLSFTQYGATAGGLEFYPLSCFGTDGLIGRDFLKNMTIQIDYREQKLILTDQPQKLSLTKAQEIPLKIHKRSSLPYIQVHINNRIKEEVCFDSGSDDLFSFKQKTVEKLNKKKKLKSSEIITYEGASTLGASGRFPPADQEYKVFVSQMTFANYTIQDFYTDITKKSRSRVGTGLCKYGKVTIDYLAKKFYFEPYADPPKAKELLEFGVKVLATEKELKVMAVLKGGEADRAGIKMGSIIMSVDGEKREFLTEDQRCEFYMQGTGWEKREMITVVFKNEGEGEKEVSLKRIIR